MDAPAKQPKPKHEAYSETMKNVLWTISIIISTALLVMTWNVQHRLDVRDAYFSKGLIDGARDREKAYFAERARNEKIVEHCKSNPCKLPSELSVTMAEIRFESIENLLLTK